MTAAAHSRTREGDGAVARVAFVTHAALPALSADDRLAIPLLEARGIAVQPAAWDDPGVDWAAFDLVLLRSTWDYPQRAAEFLAWVDRLAAARAPLWNPPALVRWNMDKRYLRELEAAGVPIAPTHWVDGAPSTSLRQLLSDRGWRRAVVKPLVSANALHTWTTSLEMAEADDQRFRSATSQRALMVQCFAEGIVTEGEWSLVFFGRELSHAVLKRPAAGDFRVQEQFAGTYAAATPDADIIAAARAALRAVPHPWLYARVDIVRDGGTCRIMELEMLEPSLFLGADPEHAPGRLADAVAARLATAPAPGSRRTHAPAAAPRSPGRAPPT